MLNNKKIFSVLAVLVSTSFVNAAIVGVGQVGGHYVYKINGILVSVSAGDIIDGCVVKAGSGLQCSQQNNNLNNDNALRDLNKNLRDLNGLLDKNQLLSAKLAEKNEEVNRIKTTIGKKLIQKNKQINQLSDRLNAMRSR